jgi:pSer/pThr/pTyr-binding forkhead associated (FHA) protein
MAKVILTVRGPGGRREMPLSADRLTVGRGESADLQIEDEGLSRVHASINRQDDRVWVLDEGSTNGSFLNGVRVAPTGTALQNGDRIEIGHDTIITVSIAGAEQPSSDGAMPAWAPTNRPLVIAAAAAAILVVLIAIVVSPRLFTSSGNRVARNERSTNSARESDEVSNEDMGGNSTSGGADQMANANSPALEIRTRNANDQVAPRKRYLQMSDQERLEFIDREARRVSMLISNRAYVFNDDVLRYIKKYVDGYASRAGNRSTRLWGEDLESVFQRAHGYAPIIIRSFNARGVPPAVGLYIVMIETEYHNIRSENSAGAAGLFQFIGPTARGYGVDPADRTDVDKMAPAAARYLAERIAEFGPDAMSVALAIAGYNRSPDSVRRDLQDVVNSENKERSFWTLVANSDKLDHWFQNENVKYVPKFFAAAIVGENPWAFGLTMNPLSTYSQAE